MQPNRPLPLKDRLIARIHVPEALLRHMGWTTIGYLSAAAVRFGNNLVLTRILAPELFGIMILLTSLRVGFELFTDIGISQNVVANKNAQDPRFYETAWTLQVLRGVVLALVSAALIPVISSLYSQKELTPVLPFLCLFFLLTGFTSVGHPLAVKAFETKRNAIYEAGATIAGSLLMIGAAFLFPNIWGLLAGNLLSTLAATVGSYLILPGLHHRFRLDRRYVGEIAGFGKWIFVSSVIYFLAMNLDRLVLPKYASFAMLGIYGVARSLGDVFVQFGAKIGYAIIFPGVATSLLRGDDLRGKLSHRRLQFLVATLVSLAMFIALSDVLIRVLYDPRYISAGKVLPLVGFAAWLSIMNTLNDNVLLGLGTPIYGAIGNSAKLLGLICILPWGLINYGIVGAAIATLVAEAARYGCLTFGQARNGVGFGRQDFFATVALVAVVLVVRSLGYEIGLTGSPVELFWPIAI